MEGDAAKKANGGIVAAHRLSTVNFYKQNFSDLLFCMCELDIIG